MDFFLIDFSSFLQSPQKHYLHAYMRVLLRYYAIKGSNKDIIIARIQSRLMNPEYRIEIEKENEYILRYFIFFNILNLIKF